MTDIEQALTEALAERGYWRHDYQNRDHAKRILATPSMQAIARQAAIGAAVERLPEYMHLERYDGEWHVIDPRVEVGSTCQGHAPTVPEAIAAALGDAD